MPCNFALILNSVLIALQFPLFSTKDMCVCVCVWCVYVCVYLRTNLLYKLSKFGGAKPKIYNFVNKTNSFWCCTIFRKLF